jgi:hypothetical protein
MCSPISILRDGLYAHTSFVSTSLIFTSTDADMLLSEDVRSRMGTIDPLLAEVVYIFLPEPE